MRSDGIELLAALMKGRRVLALSGAGMSTESGIPDYRGPRSVRRRTRPIYYREFVENPASRARYWARSAVGWPHVSAARPNRGHEALARMEGSDAITGVVTQNVDGLHQAAGSVNVLELHGTLAEVVCLSCGTRERRAALQQRILSSNPAWAEGDFRTASAEPDGDARLEPPTDNSFQVPACLHCGGVLKPDVIFFGENVPRARVERAFAMLKEADVLLVVGSSLAIYSGYRFVLQARDDEKPVAIVNQGPTRGDPLAAVRIEAALGDALPRLERSLFLPPATA
ncbi:MAG TPA: NAD-dependent protein deacetylase [Spirochaetia bacterium]|nr:NAD-dependent protein deacetylase [Spirochaetia bacterium]